MARKAIRFYLTSGNIHTTIYHDNFIPEIEKNIDEWKKLGFACLHASGNWIIDMNYVERIQVMEEHQLDAEDRPFCSNTTKPWFCWAQLLSLIMIAGAFAHYGYYIAAAITAIIIFIGLCNCQITRK